MSEPQVTIVSLDDLTLDPQNARSHPEKNLDAIKASLTSFGQVEPLVVQASSGRVIGGNGRLRAMRELGWSEASVVVVDVDDTKATALGIALNRTAELAEWDYTRLADLLGSLDSQLVNVAGFTTEELETLIDGATKRSVTFEANVENSRALTYSVIVDFGSEQDQARFVTDVEQRGLAYRLLIT